MLRPRSPALPPAELSAILQTTQLSNLLWIKIELIAREMFFPFLPRLE
jgi:hypothetical protein